MLWRHYHSVCKVRYIFYEEENLKDIKDWKYFDIQFKYNNLNISDFFRARVFTAAYIFSYFNNLKGYRSDLVEREDDFITPAPQVKKISINYFVCYW